MSVSFASLPGVNTLKNRSIVLIAPLIFGACISESDHDLEFTRNGSLVVPPSIDGELLDGTIEDVAYGNGVVYLAQGRNLARLDPATGARQSNLLTFPTTLRAVETSATGDVYVAEDKRVNLFINNGPIKRYDLSPLEGEVIDFKAWPDDDLIAVSTTEGLLLLDSSGNNIARVSLLFTPPSMIQGRRVTLAEAEGKLVAFWQGVVAGANARGQYGLGIVDLDRAGSFANPSLSAFVDPAALLQNPSATVNAVRVHNEVAYVAGGKAQLLTFDVSDIDTPTLLQTIPVEPAYEVLNLAFDERRDRLFVVSNNVLHTWLVRSQVWQGKKNLGLWDGGERDLGVQWEADKRVFAGVHHQVDYVLVAADVSGNGDPQLDWQDWWISSSDGATAIPEWDSVYLPTFGGLARYDVSTVSAPTAAGYQPAGGTIEHVDVVYPDLQDPNNALILTATGTGGVRAFPVSNVDPDPGPPTLYRSLPAGWEGSNVYSNDATSYQAGGRTYLVSDVTKLPTSEVALQVYDMTSGTTHSVIEANPALRKISSSVEVVQDKAVVTCEGGFFVVDLSALPAGPLTISDEVLVDVNNDGTYEGTHGAASSSDGSTLWLATDEQQAVLTYSFDPNTGVVTGPTGTFTDPALTGNTNRIRYHEAADRLYVPGRGGYLFEFDTTAPSSLDLISTWHSGGYNGETQDARIFDFGSGPRVLMVKNNQGFAILDPDDGL